MHDTIEGFEMPSPAVVDETADLLRIMADPTRLKLLIALAQGETSVACLAELADASPTAVSQHLSKLRLAGIVRARRSGTYMFYTLADPSFSDRLRAIVQAAIADEKVPALTSS